MTGNINIQHLYHSGVAVWTPDLMLVFDYYRGDDRELKSELRNREGAYVFVSHGHGDHFNRKIFDWQRLSSGIKYVISDDVRVSRKEEEIYSVKPDERLRFDALDISTYGSTDSGVSFLVEGENFSVFHAGDLNWWHWKSFSEEELKREEGDYKREVDKFKDKDIDIAFVPVDPRLEEYYYLAGEYFITEVNPGILVPIHFGDNYEITDRFADHIGKTDVRILRINKRSQKKIL